MNIKTALLIVLVFSVFLIGCESKTSGYASYNQPHGQEPPQQGQYVSGGCGVAPSAEYSAPSATNSQTAL